MRACAWCEWVCAVAAVTGDLPRGGASVRLHERAVEVVENLKIVVERVVRVRIVMKDVQGIRAINKVVAWGRQLVNACLFG